MNDSTPWVKIPLACGKFALVDESDADRVRTIRWTCDRRKRTTYVICSLARCRRLGKLYLHRFILGCEGDIDHENRNGLDCRRRNLRPCGQSQNNANARRRIDNTSGYRGVSWSKANRGWGAWASDRGKTINLGTFATPEEAARSYDEDAIVRYGSFSRLNFPEDHHG